MLTESDIVPGRFYLCRVEYLDGWRLTVGRRAETGNVIRGPDWLNSVKSESVQVLRELDLEAMAAECEAPRCAPCLGSGWTQDGLAQCLCCGGTGRAKPAQRWSDEVEAEIERVAE